MRKAIILAAAALLVAASSAQAQWTTFNAVDGFGSRTDDVVASSASSGARLGFPYGDMSASLMVDCDSAWIRFSSRRTNISMREGHQVRTRIDSQDLFVRGYPGERDVQIRGRGLIHALKSGNVAEFLIPWHRDTARLRFTLDGSSRAIDATCDSGDEAAFNRIRRAQERDRQQDEKRKMRERATDHCRTELGDVNHPEWDRCWRARRNELYEEAGYDVPGR